MTVESMIQDTLREGLGFYKQQYVAFIIGAIIAAIGSIFIITAPPLMFGVYYMALKIMRGEKAEINDVFRGFDYFITSWVMFIVGFIAVLIGLVCLIIPGLFLIVVFQYAAPIAMMEKKGGIDALKRSYALGRENLAYSVVLLIALTVINGIAGLIPFLGLITAPYTVLATCVAAQKLTAQEPKKTA